MDTTNGFPLIDFDSFLHGTAGDRQNVAVAVDTALSVTGFMYLKNHGIDQSKVEECFRLSKRFFALAETEKTASRSLDRSRQRGYSGVGDEKIRDRVCIKEAFSCGNSEDAELPNVWPSDVVLPGFRASVESFFQDCARLVHQLLDCLSLALKLPSDDSLVHSHAQSDFDLNLIHYPAFLRPLHPLGPSTRIPAHADFGSLTLLFQDDVGGLEVADPGSAKSETSAEYERSGRFRPVDPKPGTVVVNVGYLLMRWSNGRWKSAVHRVVEPRHHDGPTNESARDAMDGNDGRVVPARFSIAFFTDPDAGAVVDALPGCWSAANPKRWKPLDAGEYLRKKRESSVV